MSNEIKAALIGLAGALVGSILTYIATMRAVRQQIDAQEHQAGEARKDTIISVVADFLTEGTAYQAKGDPNRILPELDHQLERLVKNLHLRGDHDLANDVANQGENYFVALRLYINDGMSAEELNRHRVRVRDEIEKLIVRHLGRASKR